MIRILVNERVGGEWSSSYLNCLLLFRCFCNMFLSFLYLIKNKSLKWLQNFDLIQNAKILIWIIRLLRLNKLSLTFKLYVGYSSVVSETCFEVFSITLFSYCYTRLVYSFSCL